MHDKVEIVVGNHKGKQIASDPFAPNHEKVDRLNRGIWNRPRLFGFHHPRQFDGVVGEMAAVEHAVYRKQGIKRNDKNQGGAACFALGVDPEVAIVKFVEHKISPFSYYYKYYLLYL